MEQKEQTTVTISRAKYQKLIDDANYGKNCRISLELAGKIISEAKPTIQRLADENAALRLRLEKFSAISDDIQKEVLTMREEFVQETARKLGIGTDDVEEMLKERTLNR